MFRVQLNDFEGPMDLLLYFIRRDELNIHDIPIAPITKEFIEVIDSWKKMKFRVAGDFIIMAATLMRIKSRMLLPQVKLDNDDVIDPRTQLIQQLIEYKKYKEISVVLKSLSEKRSSKIPRQFEYVFKKTDIDLTESALNDITLFNLAKYFKNAIENRPLITTFELKREPIKLETQKSYIINKFNDEGFLSFSKLMAYFNSKIEIIVSFLAILELIKEGYCNLIQDEVFGDLELQKVVML